MRDPAEDLPVELIFLLASVTGADSHLDDLQDLMDCFTRTGLLTDLKKAETPEEFAAVFAACESYPEG